MDADTRTLIERTRQRREILNQKFSGMPEAAPRKRRTPVLEKDGSERVITKTADPDDESHSYSPKRQCLRDVELNIKEDTPAIRGVRSRIRQLKSGEIEQNGNDECSTPTPKPRKSTSSPPLERKSVSPWKAATPASALGGAATNSRKNRFAALANNINNWEDDMSHHVIHKEEEKKPRWQPPVKTDTAPTAMQSTSAKLSSSTASPNKTTGSPAKTRSQAVIADVKSPAKVASPKKTHAPPTPRSPAASVASPLARNSPLRSSKVEWNRSPKPFSSTYMANAVSPSKSVIQPVTPAIASPKASSSSKSTLPPATNAAYTKPPKPAAALPVNAPGVFETPPDVDLNSSVNEPTKKAVSQRRAIWANRVDSPQPSKVLFSSHTPRSRLASSMKAPKALAQVIVPSLSASTPAGSVVSSASAPNVSANRQPPSKSSDPCELPVSERMSRMQEKLSRKHQEEPTAFSVGARMSAWEDMTAANKVSDVKKVDPSQSTPHAANNKPRPVSGVTPKLSASAPDQVSSGVPKAPPLPTPATTTKGVAASKSFKESLQEKAGDVSRRTGLQYAGKQQQSPVKSVSAPATTAKSPGRNVAHSPTKVSAGTRGMQQHLVGLVAESGTSCSQMAAQNRAARAAELAALSNRWKNGILKDDAGDAEEGTTVETEPEPVQENMNPGEKTPKSPMNTRRQANRERARADFTSKLTEIGFADPEPSNTLPAARTPVVKVDSTKSNTASIYNLIKKRDEATPVKAPEEKKVKFNDSFDDSEDEADRKIPKSASKRLAQRVEQEEEHEDSIFKKPDSVPEKEAAGCDDDSISDTVSHRDSMDLTDDDISLKGFVSEAVRRESIVGRQATIAHRMSGSSLDSYDESGRTTPCSEDATGMGSLPLGTPSRKGGYQPDDESMDDDDETEDDSNKRQAVNDLLDDAFDDTMDAEYDPDMDVNSVVMRRKKDERVGESYDPDMDVNNVVMRKKKPSQQYTHTDDEDEDDDRPYSIQAYRKSANVHQHKLAPVVRTSKWVGRQVEEEDVAMPTAQPQPDDRRAVQERIMELKELVTQEQSVIMQTSNALNKCCVGNPVFAGSSEQVECNRLLLLACQKRQCYMTEIERLKRTAQLSHDGPGPRGSLTISDIRLPLKKDFVTKIGTSHDTSTHFFILLIRNGSQLICTQMLSTHDPMVRGSLDFPNLIKINGISGNFKLTLDVYGMSVSREVLSKDKKTPKKNKTPKKMKGFALESPGGPTAVRTTSFSHVTSLELNRKCLDKSSFHLERVSCMSPLYGQIYFRLRCLMESNVEERAFLTMFDDVSGFGAWHRRWCVLSGNKLCIWKYPDDETRKDPMAVIDLKRCVSEKVGLVSRDVCARPHTFEMVTIRQPQRGERDTLVTRTYNSTTSVRHLMSADSKEERIVWCNKINRTLANLRTWNADALKPMKPPTAAPRSGAPSSSSSRR